MKAFVNHKWPGKAVDLQVLPAGSAMNRQLLATTGYTLGF
jgi:hypothetical protein